MLHERSNDQRKRNVVATRLMIRVTSASRTRFSRAFQVEVLAETAFVNCRGSGLAMPDSWNRARLRDLIDFLDPTWPSRCIIHDPLLSRKSTSYDVRRCRKHWLPNIQRTTHVVVHPVLLEIWKSAINNANCSCLAEMFGRILKYVNNLTFNLK